MVALCVTVALVGAIVYVKLAPKRYAAQAQLLVSPVPPDSTSLVGLPVLKSSSDPTRDVLTAASLITTTQVADAVAAQLHHRGSPAGLLASVQATPVGESNLVAIQANSSSAATSQRLANAFARQVVITRTAALHTAIDNILPGLRTQLASVPLADRTGPGSVGDQISQLQQLLSSNDPTITIAALAPLPSGPYSPRTKLALLAALFGGLILGLGAALAFDSVDPRLQRESQLRELFDVPVLARIPRERSGRKPRPLLPGELSFAAVEAYRTLRTMVSARAGGRNRTFLVTGSAPAEGKTTSAINLAGALAQGGASVLLIEADLRRPSIGTTLGLDPEFGTEDVLVGQAELEDALVTVAVGQAPLRVLAVREPGSELADLLSFAATERLLEKASGISNYVVIDSPPLTAVGDALPLAYLADEVIVIARLGSSRLSKLWQLHDLLLEQATYPTGLVLVGTPLSRHENYYATGTGALPKPRQALESPSPDEAEAVSTHSE